MNGACIGRKSCSVAHLAVLVTLGCVSPLAAAAAAAPRVLIDVSPTLECRDVTTQEFAESHPDQKLVEALLTFSVRLDAGSEQDLDDLIVEVTSPERRLRVVDFSPRTELASDIAGEVEVSTTTETNHTLTAGVGGTIAGDYGPAKAQLTPSAGAGVSHNNGSKETYHKLPQRHLLVASGTTSAGHGVFFKWKPSSQASFEGLKKCSLRFAVPKGWRGDWVEVTARAFGHAKSYFGTKRQPCGDVRQLAGLYLAGDLAACAAANDLAVAQLAATEYDPTAGTLRPSGHHTVLRPPVVADESMLAPPAKCGWLVSWNRMTSIFTQSDPEHAADQATPSHATDSLAVARGALAALSGSY